MDIMKQWERVLDQTLAFKRSKRYEKMTPKQKQDYLTKQHRTLKALNDAAHAKDLAWINKMKNENN